MPGSDGELRVEVVYALKHKAQVIPLRLHTGATIATAITKSGILDMCPEIDLEHNKVGVYGRIKELDDRINHGDRIEIYRPLLADPKESRRRRAAAQEKANTGRTDQG